MPNSVEATITQKTGVLYVERSGERLSLEVGDAIYESDLIITGPDTTAEVQYRDGTKSRLAPDTQMRLVDYEFDATVNSENSFLVDVVNGAMRTVTGEIVKLNPDAFEIVTPRATVGIRGTEFYTLVQNGNETHAVLMIEKGHAMEVESGNSAVELVYPLQMTQLTAGQAANLIIQTLTPAQMNNLIRFNSPTLLEKLPENPNEQGDWEDIITQLIDEKSNVEGEGVELVVEEGSLSTDQILGLLSTGVVETVIVGEVDTSEVETSAGLEQEESDDLLSFVFEEDDKILDEDDDSTDGVAVQDPNPHFDTFSSGTQRMGDMENNITITQMTGGNFYLEGGNDTVNIQAFGQGASQVAPPQITRAIVPGVNPAEPYLDGGIGDDDILVGEMTGGTINGNDGADLIGVTNFYGGEIHTGDGDDTVKITNMDNAILYVDEGNHLVEIGAFNGGTLEYIGNTNLSIASTGEIIIRAASQTQPGALDVSIQNAGKVGIFSSDADDDITITNANNSMNIETFAGNDTINALVNIQGTTSFDLGAGEDSISLGNVLANANLTLDTGSENDTISLGEVNANATVGLNSGTGSDSIAIGDISASVTLNSEAGSDTIRLGNLEAGTDLFLRSGTDNDVIVLGDIKTEFSAIGPSWTISTLDLNSSDGDDAITIGKVNEYAEVDITTGLGSDTITVGDIATSAIFSLSTSDGDDAVTLGSIDDTVGSFSVSLGHGDDSITITNFSRENVSISLGSGSNSVEIEQLFKGKIVFETGSDNYIDLNYQRFGDMDWTTQFENISNTNLSILEYGSVSEYDEAFAAGFDFVVLELNTDLFDSVKDFMSNGFNPETGEYDDTIWEYKTLGSGETGGNKYHSLRLITSDPITPTEIVSEVLLTAQNPFFT